MGKAPATPEAKKPAADKKAGARERVFAAKLAGRAKSFTRPNLCPTNGNHIRYRAKVVPVKGRKYLIWVCPTCDGQPNIASFARK